MADTVEFLHNERVREILHWVIATFVLTGSRLDPATLPGIVENI